MKTKLMMMVVAIVVAVGAWADTETVGGYTWTYQINGDTAVIFNNGGLPAISPMPTGAVTIPSTLGGKSVTSIGVSAFSCCSGITSVVIPDSVTSIGDWAFYGCSGLTSVTIPNSVTSIGEGAFFGCSGLTSVTIPGSVSSIGHEAFSDCRESLFDTTTIPGVKSVDGWAVGNTGALVGELDLTGIRGIGDRAFRDCRGLTSVTIPNSVTSIGDCAFFGCRGLTSVTIGNGVTSIGDCAFQDCYSLTSVTIPDSVTSVGDSVFYNCSHFLFDTTTIPGVELVDGWAVGNTGTLAGELNLMGIRGIGDYAFSDCSGLTSVTIGNGVTSIGQRAFEDCSGLTSVTIPGSVTSIGDGAFSGCNRLTSVTIGNGVTSIGQEAFKYCTDLTSVTIPDSVTCIGNGAFYGCYSLTSVTIPDGVTSIGHYVFHNCGELVSISVGLGNANYKSVKGLLLSKDGTTLIRGINGDVTMPNSVTRIEDGAFSDCYTLTSVMIPDSVTSIGDSAFSGCSGLTCVTIPDSVTSIGRGVFWYCSGLTSVTIPGSVKRVKLSAFADCSGLTSVTIGNGVTSIGVDAFNGCRGLTSVTIPDSVTSIENAAFSGCSGLTGTLTIPNSVTNIGQYAFYGCSGLASVLLPKRFEGNLDSSVFGGYPSSLKITYYDHYAIRFIRNDGTGTMKTCDFGHGLSTPLPKVASLGFARKGMVFKGWATSSANASAGKIWKTDGAVVATPTAVGTTMDAIAVWALADGYYGIKFNKNDGTGKWRGVACKYGEATALPSCGVGLGWTRDGYTFKGWATSAANAAAGKVWKGDCGTVQTAASAGTTLNVYAIWEKTLTYTIKYGKYDGTGETFSSNYVWGVESHVPTATKSPLFWQRAGFDWLGWSTSPANADAGKVWKAGWGSISKPVDEGETLSVYACWKLQSGYYAIKFFRNDGTAAWRSKAFQHGVATRLPTVANGLHWSRAGYAFKGWATSVAKAAAGTVYRDDWGMVTSPVAAGQTLTLYAIWRPLSSANPAVRSASAGVSRTAASGAQSSAIAVPQTAAAPGYYVGRLADDTGAYELIVGDDQDAGIVRIDFDSGESLFAEVEIVILTDAAIVVATEDGDTYWLLP